MAKFKIIKTQKIKNEAIADFEVEFIQGILKSGDKFNTYETHHQVKWTVIEVVAKDNYCLLKCKTTLGLSWDNQFAGSIVDTDVSTRSGAYKYPPI